jgi:hypothetical protein
MAQISCPWCFELHSIRHSRLRMRDLPRFLLGKRPYRCRTCGNRFYQRVTHLSQEQKNASSTTADQSDSQ